MRKWQMCMSMEISATESSDWKKCRCLRGSYDPQGGRYSSCYRCYKERKMQYAECLWCGAWHAKEFACCFKCRAGSPEREEATQRLKLVVMARDEFRCRNCFDAEDLQVDHIKPCAKGGTAAPWNLQVLCAKCNHLKADNWSKESIARYGWQMEKYWGPLYSYLDEDERRELAEEVAPWFGVPSAPAPQRLWADGGDGTLVNRVTAELRRLP